MKIHWLGGPTFILEMGAFRLLSDPVFGAGDPAFTMPVTPPSKMAGQPIRRLVDLPPHDLDNLDAVVLTRIGEDHFDRAAGDAIDRGQRLIAPAGDTHVLTEHGFTDVTGLAWGEAFRGERDGATMDITAVPTSFDQDRPSNGYVARHTAGDTTHTVYWTGDTRWFKGARQIKELSDRFDLLVPYIGDAGDHGTLDGKDAMQFVFLVQPKRIVPVNYNTFSHYNEGVDDFRERIGLTLYDKRLQVIREGESFER